MKPSRRRLAAVAVAVPITAFGVAFWGGNDDAVDDLQPPVVVEEYDDSETSRLTLSESAAVRLGIETTVVESVEGGFAVPRAAVIIDSTGTYWVYTNPEPLVFRRHALERAFEEGQHAFFEAGPAAGTRVVITGVPELYGAEFGIGY